jgi:D-3-phosphoglycerate dehydrogenase / 2-oxoglutarate reductase
LAYDPYITKQIFEAYNVENVCYKKLLSESDYISIHAPLTNETRNLLNEEHFGLMKPGVNNINTSRGAIINEKALITAFQDGIVAALGVLEKEPPEKDNPLLNMSNVIITPHMGGYSEEARIEKRQTMLNDLSLIFSKKWPLNLVNNNLKSDKKARFLI